MANIRISSKPTIAVSSNQKFLVESAGDGKDYSVTPQSISDFAFASASKTTDNLTQGSTNRYYATSLFNADLATKTTTNLAEGANLYFTQARFDTAFSAKTTDNLTQGSTNRYYATSLFNADLATKTTANLAEGANLYFTDARARTALATSADNLTGVNTSALVDGSFTQPKQANFWLDESNNHFKVKVRKSDGTFINLDLSNNAGGGDVTSVFGRTGDIVATLGDYTTTLVTEGTNLYYTDARVLGYLNNQSKSGSLWYFRLGQFYAGYSANAYDNYAAIAATRLMGDQYAVIGTHTASVGLPQAGLIVSRSGQVFLPTDNTTYFSKFGVNINSPQYPIDIYSNAAKIGQFEAVSGGDGYITVGISGDTAKQCYVGWNNTQSQAMLSVNGSTGVFASAETMKFQTSNNYLQLTQSKVEMVANTSAATGVIGTFLSADWGASFIRLGNVTSGQNAPFGYDHSSQTWQLNYPAGTNAFYVSTDTGDLWLSGSIAYKQGGGSWTASSDGRFKQNKNPLNKADSLSRIKRMNPISYRWKPEYLEAYQNVADKQYSGFDATEIIDIYPDSVSVTKDEKLGVTDFHGYQFSMEMFADMVAAIQLLAAEIETLKRG